MTPQRDTKSKKMKEGLYRTLYMVCYHKLPYHTQLNNKKYPLTATNVNTIKNDCIFDTMTISTSAFIAIARTGRSITKAVSPRVTFPSISLLSHHDDDLYRFSSNTVLRAYTVSPLLAKKAWDPSLDQYKYWNREDSKKGEGASRVS